MVPFAGTAGRLRARRSRCARRSQRSRRAMTLLELMLVLGLLVIIASLSLPAFRGPMENQRLRKAAELVRIHWNKARIRAMKTGQTYMFRYQLESGTFQIEPYYSQQDWLEADAQHSLGTLGTSATMAGAATSQAVAPDPPRQLPEGVVFVVGNVLSDVRSMQVQQGQDQRQAAPLATGFTAGVAAEMTSPILFYPDGTTSDAKLALTNAQQQVYVLVRLRSLTGIASVSDLMTADVLQLQFQ